MIATFALVLAMFNGGMVVIPHYPSLAKCEAAGTLATQGERALYWHVTYSCVPEPTPDNVLLQGDIFGGGDGH